MADESRTADSPDRSTALDWRIATVLLVGTACLAVREAFEEGQISSPWTSYHFNPGLLFGYGLIPLCALALLRINPLAYFRLGKIGRTLPVIAAVLAAKLVEAFVESRSQTFRDFYGHWPRDSARLFVAGVALNTIAGEFFFRGFLLFPLEKRFGAHAALISTMPYCIAHMGKPLAELFLSIPFGIALAYVALRTRSLWYGVLIHAIFGLSMVALAAGP